MKNYILAIFMILIFTGCNKSLDKGITVNGKSITNEYKLVEYGTKPVSSFALNIGDKTYIKLQLPDNTTCEEIIDRNKMQIVDKQNLVTIYTQMSWETNTVKNFNSFAEAISNVEKVIIYTPNHSTSDLNMEY